MKTSKLWDGSLGELTFLDIPAGEPNPMYDTNARLDVHESHALLDGQPVGTVSIAPYERSPKDLQPGEISAISVRKDLRGNGIGRALVQHAQDIGWDPRHSRRLLEDGMHFVKHTPEFGMVPKRSAKDKSYLTRISSEGDYGYRNMQHRPPTAETGAPLHDLTGGGNIYPDDIYTKPRIYDFGEPGYREVHQLALRVRGKPDAMVDIYRSGPKPEINPGDWVSPSYENARGQGLHPTDASQDLPVWHARVPAKFLHTQGDSLPEFGYNGTERLVAEPWPPKKTSARGLPPYVRS